MKSKSIAELIKAAKFAGLEGTEVNDFVIRYISGVATMREERARAAGN